MIQHQVLKPITFRLLFYSITHILPDILLYIWVTKHYHTKICQHTYNLQCCLSLQSCKWVWFVTGFPTDVWRPDTSQEMNTAPASARLVSLVPPEQEVPAHHWPLCRGCWQRLISPKSSGFLTQTHDTGVRPPALFSQATEHASEGKGCFAHNTEVKGPGSCYRSPRPASLLIYIFVRKNQGCFYICEWKGSHRIVCKVVFLSSPSDLALDNSQERKAIASSPAVNAEPSRTKAFPGAQEKLQGVLEFLKSQSWLLQHADQAALS